MGMKTIEHLIRCMVCIDFHPVKCRKRPWTEALAVVCHQFVEAVQNGQERRQTLS